MRCLIAAAIALCPVVGNAQEPPPPQITDEAIQQGRTLFGGTGLCMACHGPEGKGIPNLGADLTDDEWLQSDGTFNGILETVLNGVGADESSTGAVMPPKGGSRLSEDQLRAVVAYVWTLSRPKR